MLAALQALRGVSNATQTAWLFVALFGGLSLVTAASSLYAMRELSTPQREAYDVFKRERRAVWLGAILFWVAWVLGAVAAGLLFGVVSFLALREFITLTHTTRADHRSLLLVFFGVLPLQFVLAGGRWFDLFSVFIPVYVFLAIPVLSALGNDPQRFLERTAKIQWGIMVCVFGLSHVPALLLLDTPATAGRGSFLVFFVVMVVSAAQLAQEAATRWLRRRPVARAISRSFSWRAFGLGLLAAGVVGAGLFWATPLQPLAALGIGAIAGGCGTLGELVMKALKRDAGVRNWAGRASVTGAVGLLDRAAPLCFAAPVFFHSVHWFIEG
jgi:phosphatidate cytidylyltransferase